MNESYALVGKFLGDQGRPVVYHPSNLGFRFPRQFRELSATAHQWRWFNDVQDNWESVVGIINEIGAGQPTCTPGAIPAECEKWASGDLSTRCAAHCSEVRPSRARRSNPRRMPRPRARRRVHRMRVPLHRGAHAPPARQPAHPRHAPVCRRRPAAPAAGGALPLGAAARRLARPRQCAQLSHRARAVASYSSFARAVLLLGNTPCSDADKDHGLHCGSLTADEEKTQLAVWAMSAAPLFMSNDLPAVPAASRDLLLNKEVLAVNQDALGRMGFRFYNVSGAQGWRKELANGDVAVALLNMADGRAAKLPFSFADAGFAPDSNVALRDLFGKKDLGTFAGGYTSGAIPPHGSVLYRLSFVPTFKARKSEL
jgi:hypothetical protein